MGNFVKCTFVILAFVNIVFCSDKKVVCYYGTWATYRWGLGKFDVDNVNPDLCTHLVYTFVGLNPDGSGTVINLDPYLDLPDNWGKNNFGKLNALKEKNPNLKTMLAVGGWNEGSAKYSAMAADANLRQAFVTSAVNMVAQYNFDGFDVDWEYPNRRDSVHGQADVDNFTQLLKELKQALEERGLLLSIAVAAVKSVAAVSYDVAAISHNQSKRICHVVNITAMNRLGVLEHYYEWQQLNNTVNVQQYAAESIISSYVDFINLMTYDMYGSWDPVTGHNAPLHRGEGDESIPRSQVYSVDVALEYWISSGCPPEKLNLGLPIYGRTFTLSNAADSGVRAPSSGTGIAGPFTQTNGLIGYNEFCVKLQSEEWEVRYDSLAKAPYAVQGLNWVSYDNVASVQSKIEYGLSLGIGGAMVWSIETDDFHGLCGEDFPILRAITRALGLSGGTTTTASTSSTTTTLSTTTTQSPSSSETPVTSPSSEPSSPSSKPSSPSSEPSSSSSEQSSPSVPSSPVTETTTAATSVCKEEGFIPNPKDCTKFFYCIRNTEGGLQAIGFGCPEKLAWDQSILACNYAEIVQCHI